MFNQEYSAKFTIKDIEPKQDRNFNPYYLLYFENNNYKFGYAFKSIVNSENWTTLINTPEQLVNRLVKIVYQLNQTLTSTYFQNEDHEQDCFSRRNYPNYLSFKELKN
ncbi:MAG: hypothetical protein mread185_000222 [Mycoplasmataceae bacterium]|nr:MAG: hypothetical protein mread185_000222 [Mycoplasmataceae bacterium]